MIAHGVDIFGHIKGITEAIKGVRMNLKPSVREILKREGDKRIHVIFVVRRPLSSVFSSLVDLTSKISFFQNKTHDQLFHLFLVFKLEDDTLVVLEKNEDINMSIFKPSTVDESIKFNVIEPVTINMMLSKVISTYGTRRIFEYDAFSNNCQRFVMDFLISNGINLSQPETSFILQDVSKLAPDWARKLTHGVTSFYNRAKMAIFGYGLQYKKGFCPACGHNVIYWKKHMKSNSHIKNVLSIKY